ncbi:MAG TPA: hypothetical protein VGF52_01175, partial [Tepidisphaeraceae bacterium]
MAFTSSVHLFVAASLFFLIGCREPTTPPPAGYFGATLPMEQVVTQINANAEQIPTLRGAGS